MTLVPGDEAIDVPVVAREPVAIQAWPPKARVLCGTNMSIILGVGGAITMPDLGSINYFFGKEKF